MPRLQQDALFPTVLYFASQDEATTAMESAANEAGALVDIWRFDPTPERPSYLGADNSETARSARVAGAMRWENADVVAISDRLPAERIQSIAEGAGHLKKIAALMVSQETKVDWVVHSRFSPLRPLVITELGKLVHGYIEDRVTR